MVDLSCEEGYAYDTQVLGLRRCIGEVEWRLSSGGGSLQTLRGWCGLAAKSSGVPPG